MSLYFFVFRRLFRFQRGKSFRYDFFDKSVCIRAFYSRPAEVFRYQFFGDGLQAVCIRFDGFLRCFCVAYCLNFDLQD
jgi:hypothetical protein